MGSSNALKICSETDCGLRATHRGMCNRHYYQHHRPRVLCGGTCGRMLPVSHGCLPPGQHKCFECRRAALPPSLCADCGSICTRGSKRCRVCVDAAKIRVCAEPDCARTARKRGLCSTHYNRANGHYIGDVPKDPARERARLRIKTHRRRDWSRITDITPEYEIALRAKAKRCPLCSVKMTDVPYLPHSKELDHIIPRGVGGTHTIGNVRIICGACNKARPNNGSDYSGPVTLWAQEVA